MLSSASERLNHAPSRGARVQGAMLALLVQASFVLMILLSPSRLAPPHNPTRETILLLHPQPQPTPRSIDARGTLLRKTAPIRVPILPNITSPLLAPPTGIAGFGRSLFGCAPERYADLPPDEKAHCPKPGEGMAGNQPPDLLKPPKSHAKDEALWLEELAERRWSTECVGVINVLKCLIAQDRAEHNRIKAARQKIADDKALARQESKRPMPRIGVRRN